MSLPGRLPTGVQTGRFRLQVNANEGLMRSAEGRSAVEPSLSPDGESGHRNGFL